MRLFFWSNRQHITGKWPGLFSISMNEQFLPNNFFQFIDFQWLLVFNLIWYGTDCYLLTPNVTALQLNANNSSITNLHFRGHRVSANLKFAANIGMKRKHLTNLIKSSCNVLCTNSSGFVSCICYWAINSDLRAILWCSQVMFSQCVLLSSRSLRVNYCFL